MRITIFLFSLVCLLYMFNYFSILLFIFFLMIVVFITMNKFKRMDKLKPFVQNNIVN